MRINSGISLDDVAYIAVLTAAISSIAISTVVFLDRQARAGDPVAQQCERMHSNASAPLRAG